MGAILAYFGSKMYLLLIGADLNTQFKIVYADGTKMGDKSETNTSDLRSASENDVNNDLKARVLLIDYDLRSFLTLSSHLTTIRSLMKSDSSSTTRIEERPRYPMM